MVARSNRSNEGHSTPSNILKFIFYLLVFSIFLHGLVEDWTRYLNDDVFKVLGTKEHHMFGGRSKYLTFLDMNLQFFYFFLMTIQAFNECCSFKMSLLKKFCNFLYVSLCFPLGVFVFFSFWSIYLIDRELVWASAVDRLIPQYQNHIMHTLPFFGVLIDNLLSRKNYGDSLVKGYIPLLLAMIGYTCWVLIIKNVTNTWAYPVLDILTNSQIVMFFIALKIFLSVLFVSGKKLNSFLWKNENHVDFKKEF
jgi:hypothetical protein